jgi:hypothetical protein
MLTVNVGKGGFTRSEAPRSLVQESYTPIVKKLIGLKILSPIPNGLELSKFSVKCDVNDRSLI